MEALVKIFSAQREFLDVKYRRQGIKVPLQHPATVQGLLDALQSQFPQLGNLKETLVNGQLMVTQSSKRLKDLGAELDLDQPIWIIDPTQGG